MAACQPGRCDLLVPAPDLPAVADAMVSLPPAGMAPQVVHDAVLAARFERARRTFSQRCTPSVSAEGYIQFSDYPYATAAIRYYAGVTQQAVIWSTYVAGGALTATTITMLVIASCSYSTIMGMVWCFGPQVSDHRVFKVCTLAAVCALVFLTVGPFFRHESEMPFQSRVAFMLAAGVVTLMVNLALALGGTGTIRRAQRITSLWRPVRTALVRTVRALDVFSDIGLVRLYYDSVRPSLGVCCCHVHARMQPRELALHA
jgi:hypothetical protein